MRNILLALFFAALLVFQIVIFIINGKKRCLIGAAFNGLALVAVLIMKIFGVQPNPCMFKYCVVLPVFMLINMIILLTIYKEKNFVIVGIVIFVFATAALVMLQNGAVVAAFEGKDYVGEYGKRANSKQTVVTYYEQENRFLISETPYCMADYGVSIAENPGFEQTTPFSVEYYK